MTAAARLRCGLTLMSALVALSCVGPTVKLSNQRELSYDPSQSRTIRASECGYQVFGWVPLDVLDRAQRAYYSLLSQASGDVILDVKVRERWYYALIMTIYCTDLEATAYTSSLRSWPKKE